MRGFYFTLLLAALVACKHPLAIQGEGDISERLAGIRGCSLEEFLENSPQCTDNEVMAEAYQVSYEANPRDGWRFLGWQGTVCSKESTPPFCDYDIDLGLVNAINDNLPDLTLEATTASFVRHTTTQLTVSAFANGGFGPFLGGIAPGGEAKDMVVAAVLKAGERVTLSSQGQINVADPNPEFFTTADGFNRPPESRPSPLFFFPLEEARVDSGDLPVPVPMGTYPLMNIGALIGAFVPIEAATYNFSALNNDPDPNEENFSDAIPAGFEAGDVSSDQVFLVGSGPLTFEAPEDGVLVLGVNDANVNNNAGAFTVTVSFE